jgi:hypothetical protein
LSYNVLDAITLDEEDVFQCGKCKKQFTSFCLFMSHKKEHAVSGEQLSGMIYWSGKRVRKTVIFKSTRNSVFLVYQQSLASVVTTRLFGKILACLYIQSYFEAVLLLTVVRNCTKIREEFIGIIHSDELFETVYKEISITYRCHQNELLSKPLK